MARSVKMRAGRLTAASPVDIRTLIAAVAEEHAPDGGYGETAWNAGTSTVYWVSADWTSNDEHDAAYEAFQAIEGVDNVEGDAEAGLPTGDGWEQVWPHPDSDLALGRVLELARRPL